jgi:hypothetical protein
MNSQSHVGVQLGFAARRDESFGFQLIFQKLIRRSLNNTKSKIFIKKCKKENRETEQTKQFIKGNDEKSTNLINEDMRRWLIVLVDQMASAVFLNERSIYFVNTRCICFFSLHVMRFPPSPFSIVFIP